MKKNSEKFKPTKEDFKQLYIQLAICLPIGLFFLIGGIYEKYRVKKVFEERGKITTATIIQWDSRTVDFSYVVNGKTYFKTNGKAYMYEFKTGKKYKLIYDPLNPETAELCRDENKQYFLMEDSVKQSGIQTDKVEPNRGKQ